MSVSTTDFRPLARVGWGGRAASHFRAKTAKTAKTAVAADFTISSQSLGVKVNYFLAGVTRNFASGAVVGNCRVELMLTAGDTNIAETISDASGNFVFPNPGTGPFYLIAYKVGAPDIAGTTVNTLVAV